MWLIKCKTKNGFNPNLDKCRVGNNTAIKVKEHYTNNQKITEVSSITSSASEIISVDIVRCDTALIQLVHIWLLMAYSGGC